MKNILKNAALTLAGGAVGAVAVGSTMNKKVQTSDMYAQKHLAIMEIMNQWIIDKQNGKSLVTYFAENGYKKIAIYGLSYLGERLVDELENSEIKVEYGIDKNADNIYSNIDVFTPEDDLEEVDAVIVTAVYFFDEIEAKLEEKFECPIISLEDVVYGV